MIDEWEISNRDLYLNLVTRNEGRICINFENVVQNELFRESVDQVAAKCLTTEREKKQARLKRAFELHTKPTFWEKSWQALLNGQGGFIIPTAIFSGLAALVAKRIYGQKTAKLPDILKDQARRLDDLERRARDIDDDDDPPAPTGGGGKVPAASEASETAAESSAAETAGFAALFVGALTILGTHGHKIVGGMRSLGTSLAVGIEGAAALPFMFYDPQLMPPEYRQGGDEA